MFRLMALSCVVMPAKAGIQTRFQFNCKGLDSGFRRNDGRKSRLADSQFKLARLQFVSAYHRLRIQVLERGSREFLQFAV